MKKKIIVGTIIAVALIVLSSFSSVVGTVSSDDEFLDVKVKEEGNSTPIALVFQLIAQLRNHPNIQNVETEDDVLQIIEDDEKLNSIIEQLSGNDCSCKEEISIVGFEETPIICIILAIIVGPVYMLGTIAYMGGWVFPALELARTIFQILFLLLVPIMAILSPLALIGALLGCWE